MTNYAEGQTNGDKNSSLSYFVKLLINFVNINYQTQSVCFFELKASEQTQMLQLFNIQTTWNSDDSAKRNMNIKTHTSEKQHNDAKLFFYN